MFRKVRKKQNKGKVYKPPYLILIMNEIRLNNNDEKLLAYCYHQEKFISDIARNIGIDVKNVSVRIGKLEKMGLVRVHKMRNKKYVRTVAGDKTISYFVDLLKELKNHDGEMKQDDFFKLLPFSFSKQEDRDKFGAPMSLMNMSPPLVDVYIKISSAGEMFLKHHGGKK